MSRSNRSQKPHGFTLVEMLIIAPMALLIIAGFIGLMITMVGDIMVSHGRNALTHNIQSSLDMIEQDVRLSTEFLATTGTLPTPQGKDGATAAFTSTAGDLILGEIATDKSPVDPTRGFIYYSNAPNSCSDTAQKYKNRIFFTTVVYYVKNGSLWRRTYVPSAGGTLCAQPWQVNTCAPGYASTATQCKTNDTEVMQNVSSVTVSYYTSANGTLLTAANAPSASTINVQINGQQTVAGRTLAATASVRSTKLSDKDVTLAPPTAPTVTAQAYSYATPGTATFTWTADPLVTYSIRYNINGGAWITAAESTKNSSISLTGSRADTITVQVAARNTTGSSGFGSGASLTLPTWETCTLQNSWINYGSPHATCGYTKTAAGMIILKGLIKKSGTATTATNGETLFTLPQGYRPAYTLSFAVSTYDSSQTSGVEGRVDVQPDGSVTVIAGNTGWVSLPDINFIPSGSLYNWSDVTFQNSWLNWGSGLPPFQVLKDSVGRAHLEGRIKPGSGTASTTATQLPSGYAPSEYLHIPTSTRGSFSIDTSGNFITAGYSGSYYFTNAMYYPSSTGSWSNMTLQNSWVAYGSGNTAAQYTRASDCIVTLKGFVKNGSTTNGITLATLPVGYRPNETLIFRGYTQTNYYRLQVDAAGDLKIWFQSATYVSLDGINFMAGDGTPCPQ